MASKVKVMPNILKPIILDYKTLCDKKIDLSKELEASFGQRGNGILLVKNIPNYEKYREELLLLGYKIHMFSPEVKKKYERPDVHYAVGICTADKYAHNGVNDVATSWYCDPLKDKMDSSRTIKDGKGEVSDFYMDNFWPTEDLPELEPAFKNMGKLTCEVGFMLSHHIEKLVKSVLPTYKTGQLYDTLGQPVGRLIHYHDFHNENKGEGIFWHSDSTSITAVCSPLYMDQYGKEVPEMADEPGQGLQILKRDKSLNSCSIPKHCMAFQIGESLQIFSGGKLEATPHRVLKTKDPKYSRNQFVNFFLPKFNYKLTIPEESTEEDVFKCQSEDVLNLRPRWKNGDYFKDYMDKTLMSYL